MVHESESHEGTTFATLTYNDEWLPPPDGCLVKRDLQLFLKRLRKLVAPRRIKYYACGEYGARRRPHYHLILFGIYLWEHGRVPANSGWMILEGPLREAWFPRGHVQADRFTPRTARYVSNYITAKTHAKRSAYGPLHPFNIQPPFQLQSAGIGRHWLESHYSELYNDMGLRHGHEIHPMPRYYQKRIKLCPVFLKPCEMLALDITNRLAQRGKETRDAEAAKLITHHNIPLDDNTGLTNAWHLAHSYQKAKNVTAYDDIRNRKL